MTRPRNDVSSPGHAIDKKKKKMKKKKKRNQEKQKTLTIRDKN